jgi:hypothetical protein
MRAHASGGEKNAGVAVRVEVLGRRRTPRGAVACGRMHQEERRGIRLEVLWRRRRSLRLCLVAS